MARAKSISLHLGLNFVDPDEYEGWDGELGACEFDAKDMLAIAKRKKFSRSQLLLSEKATADAVREAIARAAKDLAAGGLFWLTYSGHGGQVPDRNGDEKDRKDETWVLYDRMLIDDELYALWAKFRAGSRIVVFSDSCHSGTVTRLAPPFVSGMPRSRLMPRRVNERVYAKHKTKYDRSQRAAGPSEKRKPKAGIVLISGCQDNQVSYDGTRNGAFTEQLRRVWNGGKFKGGYRRFRDEIAQRLPAVQSPNYSVVGQDSSVFEKQRPLTI